jgi:D-sedoheptulose 7-phosphate isomerase
MGHAEDFFREVAETARRLPMDMVEALCEELVALRAREGRLFIIGVGGSAGNSSHAVNDFRKLCGIEAYAPTDNVSELTARTNDEGWSTVFAEWLKVSHANAKDAILVFSVGGGNLEKNVSPNIVAAIVEAKARGLRVLGIVGRDGGYTKKAGDCVVIVPTVEESRVTPHA